jgi:hypothetical protein
MILYKPIHAGMLEKIVKSGKVAGYADANPLYRAGEERNDI